MSNLRLPFDNAPDAMESRMAARDRAARARAVDPRHNVVLEASAGTGKTRVLVERYVNLLCAGVHPSNVLAITFTRKAAAEMRERVLARLREAAAQGAIAPARWRELRDRMTDIAIGTIDAFCLSLLREFPLEADLDPGFTLADDSEAPRLVDESLDRALRICRRVARDDEHVALVFALLGDRRTRTGLSALLNRRLVAPAALARYLARGRRDLTVGLAIRRAAVALLDVFASMPGGLDRFLESGPPGPAFLVLGRALRALDEARCADDPMDPATLQLAFARVRDHFLTQDGQPRSRLPYAKAAFVSASDWEVHKGLVLGRAQAIVDVWDAYRRDVNAMASRGVWRMFHIADAEYRRAREAHAVLDFSDVLERALDLLRQMEEFAQSRFRLESRYHHVLVDEFQDTSRPQWELISLLTRAWGEGAGLAHSGPLPPSIFIVGDRKQSIYRFRDADVSVLLEARLHLETLRPGGDVRRSISRSFRSVRALLAFVNDVCAAMNDAPSRHDAFVYAEEDRFPLDDAPVEEAQALGLVVADSVEACAARVAGEIVRMMADETTVRDRDTGVRRAMRPADVAILFRTRESHREFEEALAHRGVASYVYKGLGFFDADEIKDALATIWYLAEPHSNLRAAAWLRSGFVRLSDEGLRRLAPGIAAALVDRDDRIASRLDSDDAEGLVAARGAAARWRGLVDRMPPAELLDLVLQESAYLVETRGPRVQQARENLKKLRALVRRMQNRGYATLARVAAYLDRLAIGDEANAAVDALDAVSLMTVHAAKGLEFPVVFIVNLARGTGNQPDPIRVGADESGDVLVSVGDFRSESDEDEVAREREETKRLLYVALTRARDRLYLSATLEDGRVQPSRGSLADVLPAAFFEQYSLAARSRSHGPDKGLHPETVDSRTLPPVVLWRGPSGSAHLFRVIYDDGQPDTPSVEMLPQAVPAEMQSGERRPIQCDFGSIPDASRPRRSVGAASWEDAPDCDDERMTGHESSRALGILVHRLLERVGLASDIPDERLRGWLLASIRAQGGGLSPHPDTEEVDSALVLYRHLVSRSDVRRIYAAGQPLHEVPFAMVDDGLVLRGTIDCLVRQPDRVIVLEFKTGRPRPEHRIQSELYARAARHLFPGLAVETRLIYAEFGEETRRNHPAGIEV
jgi:ATP-dependent helicase/nuclease subunit A